MWLLTTSKGPGFYSVRVSSAARNRVGCVDNLATTHGWHLPHGMEVCHTSYPSPKTLDCQCYPLLRKHLNHVAEAATEVPLILVQAQVNSQECKLRTRQQMVFVDAEACKNRNEVISAI